MTARGSLLPWLMGAIIVLLARRPAVRPRDELGLTGRSRKTQSRRGLRSRICGSGSPNRRRRRPASAPKPSSRRDSHPPPRSLGVVMNPAPLMELRARLLAARAEADGVRAAASFSGREHERLKALYADDRNVSQRAVQSADATLRSEQARLSGLDRGRLDCMSHCAPNGAMRLRDSPPIRVRHSSRSLRRSGRCWCR